MFHNVKSMICLGFTMKSIVTSGVLHQLVEASKFWIFTQRISVTVTTNTLSCFYIIIYWKYKNVNSFKSAKSHILKVVASKLPILNTPSPPPLLWLFGWLDSDKLTPCLVRGVTSVGSSAHVASSLRTWNHVHVLRRETRWSTWWVMGWCLADALYPKRKNH